MPQSTLNEVMHLFEVCCSFLVDPANPPSSLKFCVIFFFSGVTVSKGADQVVNSKISQILSMT